MAALILTGAAGAGKTQAALDAAKRALNLNPFATIWALLPTDLQISSFRERLLRELNQEVCFGVQTFDFYSLYTRLLRQAGLPQRQLRDTARFRILRHILGETRDELTHFQSICQTAGFVALAAAFIQELKQAKIEPDAFKAAAHDAKDHDLALIYERYQAFLRHNGLVDAEGEGWLALAQLEHDPSLARDTDLLIIDGYDQFNIVQARLLGLLAARVRQTILTLTYEPERADTAHRRYAQTRVRLFEYSEAWSERQLEGRADSSLAARPVSLQHLSQAIFEPSQTVLPGEDAIQLLELPNEQREVEWVLRQVKTALLKGAEPGDLAILARDLTAYSPYFLELAAAYDVPILMRSGMPLAQNPAMASLLALLDLAAGGFRRRAVMDALHSPYLVCPDLNAAQIDLLEQVSRAQIVTGGRAQWLDAIRRAAVIPVSEDDDTPLEPKQRERLAKLESLEPALAAFFDRVTPPKATARDLVHWVEGLIGPDEPDQADHFRVAEQIRAAEAIDPNLTARDLTALTCFKRILRDILAAYELIDPAQVIDWEQFRIELGIAIENTTVGPSREQNRIGRVLVSSIFDARGLSHDTVFLIGLSEGAFPAKAADDALYHDSERLALHKRGLTLRTHAEDADESSLFYEITTLARRRLILTRPYSQKGELWPESPYWRAVRTVIQCEPDRKRIEAAPELSEAARLSEVVAAVAQKLNGKLADTDTLSVHAWLAHHPEHQASWHNALRGRRIEMHRENGGPEPADDAHRGLLFHPLTRNAASAALGPERVWSASQFNEYGQCPFKFFARRLLKIEPLQEPEAGASVLQSGNLLHEILEQTYQACGQAGLTIAARNQTEALAMLDAVLDRLLVDAPERHGFQPGALWEQEQIALRRRLRNLVALDFSDDSPISKFLPGERRPLDQEAGFGGQVPVLIEGQAGPIRAQGYIDRIDEVNGQALIIDYKSGNHKFKLPDMIDGRNVQMLIYMAAAEQILHQKSIRVIGGVFWHLGSRETSGAVRIDEHEAEIRAAQDALHSRVIAGRAGQFPNQPSQPASSGQCVSYCDFFQFCRARAESA